MPATMMLLCVCNPCPWAMGEPVRSYADEAHAERTPRAGAPGGGPTSRSASEPTTEARRRPVDGIRDNSFLVEEAYNQEAGVVQNIFGALYGRRTRDGADGRRWDLGFTQEWPVFSQTHQFSYTIPYSFLKNDDQGDSGIGDFMLNYRYQACLDEGLLPAVSPRFSLIFPSGNQGRDIGAGAAGYQFNLPVSKTLTDRLYVNFNAGFTAYPNSSIEYSNKRRSPRSDLLDFNLGGSVIYAVTEEFNLMLEAVGNFNQELVERRSAGGRRLLDDRLRDSEVLVSPGARWAINLSGDVQIVMGVGVPIGVSRDAIDYGVFLYLSIEHPLASRRE